MLVIHGSLSPRPTSWPLNVLIVSGETPEEKERCFHRCDQIPHEALDTGVRKRPWVNSVEKYLSLIHTLGKINALHEAE